MQYFPIFEGNLATEKISVATCQNGLSHVNTADLFMWFFAKK